MNQAASDFNNIKTHLETAFKAITPTIGMLNAQLENAKQEAIKKGQEKEFAKQFVESGILDKFAELQKNISEVKWQ